MELLALYLILHILDLMHGVTAHAYQVPKAEIVLDELNIHVASGNPVFCLALFSFQKDLFQDLFPTCCVQSL